MLNKSLLQNISKLKNDNKIRDIYLFGSVARGEQDQYSDIDILIVIYDCEENEYLDLKKKYAEILEIPSSWISMYRSNKIEEMFNVGSYFLWHIKLEGVLLYSKDSYLESLLKELPLYKNINKDINEYSAILSDIMNELDSSLLSIDYELAVLASLVRNTCIAISYMDGNMNFSRTSVVMECFSKYNIEATYKEYTSLYKYRLYQTEKVNHVCKGDINVLKKWIEVETQLLQIAKKGAGKYETEII